MDRRQFVIGSAASAAALASFERCARRSIPGAPDHHHQRVSAGRHQRYRDAPDGERAGSGVQAAGRGRDQGRRGRRGRRAGRARAPSPTATRCSRTTTASPATPRSTSCSAASRRRRAPISFRWRGSAPIRCWCWSTTSSPTRRSQSSSPTRRRARTRSSTRSGGLYGASHLPVALLEKAAGLAGMRHLPTAGGGPAITAVLGNNAQLTTQTVQATLQHVKAGKLRALATFGADALQGAARRADHEGARLRRDLLSLGRPVRPEGHARADRLDADRRDRQGRRQPAVQRPARQCRPRAELSARRPSSPSSGTRTASAPTRPCVRSARCRVEFCSAPLPVRGERCRVGGEGRNP